MTGFAGGLLGKTVDLGIPGIPAALVNFIIREPVSGTYNTFEFQVPHSRDGDTANSQEEELLRLPSGTASLLRPRPRYADPVGPNCQKPR